MGRRDLSPAVVEDGSDYVIQVLTQPDEIASIQQHWKHLEGRVHDRFTYFQSFHWCAGWIRQFAAQRGTDLRVVCVWKGQDLVLLWPGTISRTPLGGKVLSTLGEPHTQYANVLLAPDHDKIAIARKFGDILRDGVGADAVHFGLVPAGSALDFILKLNGLVQDSVANETALFNLDSYSNWDEFFDSLPASQRKNRKRRRTQLAKLGDVVVRDVWPGDPDFDRLTRLCMSWKRRWLSETGRFSRGFSVRGYDDFLAGIPGDRESLSGAVLFSLEVDGQPVAIEFGFIEKRHYYSYIGSFEWELRHLSPGKVAMEASKRWLMNAGVSAYDLLGNQAEYKSSWSNCSVPLLSYRNATTLKGSLLALPWIGVVSPALKSAYAAMPELIRRTMVPKPEKNSHGPLDLGRRRDRPSTGGDGRTSDAGRPRSPSIAG